MQQQDIPKKSKNKFLIIVAGVLAALIMLASFVVALSKFSDGQVEDVSGESVQTSETVSDEISNSFGDKDDSSAEVSVWGQEDGYYNTLVMENYPYTNISSYNGPLALVSSQNGAYPSVEETKLVNIAKNKTQGIYGLSNTSLVINEDAMKDMDRFIVSFYEQVPKNGVIIDKGYTSADALVPSDSSIDLASGYTFKLSIYNSNYKF